MTDFLPASYWKRKADEARDNARRQDERYRQSPDLTEKAIAALKAEAYLTRANNYRELAEVAAKRGASQ